jgi:hypothetical protein
MPNGPEYAYIKANYDPPYAIHVLSGRPDWTSRGSDIVVTNRSVDATRMVDTYRYGVLFELTEAAGVISTFSWSVVVGSLVRYTVMFGYPKMIVSFVAMFCLGRKSKLFRRAIRRTVTLKEMYKSFAYNALISMVIFNQLDDQSNGFLDVDEMTEAFKGALHDTVAAELRERYRNPKNEAERRLHMKYPNEHKFYLDAMRRFAGLLADDFVPAQQKHDPTIPRDGLCGISFDEWVRAACFNEPLDLDDVVEKLQNPDFDRHFTDCDCLSRRPHRPQGEGDGPARDRHRAHFPRLGREQEGLNGAVASTFFHFTFWCTYSSTFSDCQIAGEC